MKSLTRILTIAVLFVSLASTAQAQLNDGSGCAKNLGTLTLKQFDSQYLRLLAENDRSLAKSDHYEDVYLNGQLYAIARVLNSSVDVTREHAGVLSYTVCKLNQVITSGPTVLVTANGKTYMQTSIYVIVYYY